MDTERQRPSRLAIGFVMVGLALSAIGIAYLLSPPVERRLPPLDEPQMQVRAQQLDALFRMLTHSFLLFLAFLLGSYLMIRVGRRVTYQLSSEKRGGYVDVWSQYRLSQEEIDTATDGLENDFPPDAPPGEREP